MIFSIIVSKVNVLIIIREMESVLIMLMWEFFVNKFSRGLMFFVLMFDRFLVRVLIIISFIFMFCKYLEK